MSAVVSLLGLAFLFCTVEAGSNKLIIKDLQAPLKLSKLHDNAPLYTLRIFVDGQPLDTIIDTGSTGLVVANKNAIRKTKSCKTSPKQCAFQTPSPYYFVCYGDGAGYVVHPDVGVDISFGNVPKTKVTLGRAIGIFDPRGSVLTTSRSSSQSLFGFGLHGDHDCSFSQNDALSDILSSQQLPRIWSLRSVTATSAGRLYLGTNAAVFHNRESRQYTLATQSAGRYSVSLSGISMFGTRARSKSSKQRISALKCVLDTGACATTTTACI